MNKAQKKQSRSNVNKDQWKKEGFLLQMASDQYLLGAGPFSVAPEPSINKWSLFYPSFFSSQSKAEDWYIPSAAAVFSKKQLLVFLEDQETKINISDVKWQGPAFTVFRNFFLNVQEQIMRNKIQKVVPVFFETADYSLREGDILALIRRLISRLSGETAYAYWSGQKAIIGGTPEYLFRKEGFYIQTMALAGTACDSQHDLLKDSKEQWEHQLVVEEIKTLLAPFGKYCFSDTYVYSVGNIWHLRTDFKLQSKSDISFEKLCYLLHPTPALGGVPREKALNLLTKFHQRHNLRYGFGSPFGALMGHKAFCVVAIRNIQFIDGRAYIGSGCGLVKGSQIKKEWEELRKKRQLIRDILF